jgi:hypothetical protein
MQTLGKEPLVLEHHPRSYQTQQSLVIEKVFFVVPEEKVG